MRAARLQQGNASSQSCRGTLPRKAHSKSRYAQSRCPLQHRNTSLAFVGPLHARDASLPPRQAIVQKEAPGMLSIDILSSRPHCNAASHHIAVMTGQKASILLSA